MGAGMKINGCRQLLKYSLFASNFLILIGGIVVTCVGAVTLRDQHVFDQLVNDELFKSISWVLIGCGIFIIIFVTFGFYGAIKEVRFFLLMYIISLLIVFVVLLIGGVLGYVFRGKTSQPMKIDLMNTMKSYNTSDTTRHHWDDVQTLFQCCGVDSYTDWESVFTEKGENIKVPPSCCKRQEEVPTCEIHPTAEQVWVEGCIVKLKEEAKVVGGVGIGVSCLMILGLISSICVFKSMS